MKEGCEVCKGAVEVILLLTETTERPREITQLCRSCYKKINDPQKEEVGEA